MPEVMDHPGNLFVVSAPSGAGKSSLVRALREFDARVYPSVSHTTRAPRGQEKHGREYYFVSDSEFDAMAANNGFAEWANVHGRRYGTSRKAIEDRIGKDVGIFWNGMGGQLTIPFESQDQLAEFLSSLLR